MSDRHVIPAEDGWHVEKDQAQRASAKTPTQAEAITRAAEIVARDGGGEVIVHGADGAVRERRAVPADADGAPGTAVATAARSAAEGVADAAVDGAAEVSDAAEAVARSGERAVVRGADRAATAGAEAGDDLEAASDRTGRRIHAVTESAAAPLDQLTDEVLVRTGRVVHTLNPVRVVGRAVGVGVAATLHVAGVVSTRGTAAAASGARRVTRG